MFLYSILLNFYLNVEKMFWKAAFAKFRTPDATLENCLVVFCASEREGHCINEERITEKVISGYIVELWYKYMWKLNCPKSAVFEFVILKLF